MPLITYRDALNQALREEMARDKDVFLMGESDLPEPVKPTALPLAVG